MNGWQIVGAIFVMMVLAAIAGYLVEQARDKRRRLQIRREEEAWNRGFEKGMQESQRT